MIRGRRFLLLAALLVSACSRRASDSGASTTTAAPAAVVPAAAASSPLMRLALHIDVYSASVADDIVVVARLLDKDAQQDQAIRDATNGQWKGSRSASVSTPVDVPAAWADRLQISHHTSEFVPIFERSMTDDGRALLVVRPILAGSRVKASLTQDGVTIESNEALIEPAPAPGLETLIARGRVNELLGRWSELEKVADGIVAADDASPWGHYYRGVVERARRNPEAAKAAFQRALDRVEPGQEPPIGLVESSR